MSSENQQDGKLDAIVVQFADGTSMVHSLNDRLEIPEKPRLVNGEENDDLDYEVRIRFPFRTLRLFRSNIVIDQSLDEEAWINCLQKWKEFHQEKIEALKEDIDSLPTFVSSLRRSLHYLFINVLRAHCTLRVVYSRLS